jgi:predicted RNA-binding protein with PIN domain
MAKQRKRLLIVDGYNVLRSGSRYQNIMFPDYTDDVFNVARERLLNDVINFAGRNTRAILVFDGKDNNYSEGKAQNLGGVQVIFSPAGQSADKVIERLAHDARAREVETLVVTSDSTIQDTVFGDGVDRMSAEGFCREMAMHYDNVALDASPEVSKKRTVGSRIPPETLAKLKKMRDA